MIKIENLSFHHQTSLVLDAVNLEIPRGGVTALVGPNGAGKSTLLALAARLLPLETGSVLIDDLDVSKTPGKVLAKKLAILRQDGGPPARVSVRDMIGFGRFPHSGGRLIATDREAVDEAMDRFELTGLAARSLDQLSGGQRQRVMIAMTYCQGTDYIFLDEPLNNLDMYHARQLMGELRTLADERQRTIVIVLHDINHAATQADRIIAMKGGRIVADGSPLDIMQTHVLEPVFGFAVDVVEINGKPIALPYAGMADKFSSFKARGSGL